MSGPVSGAGERPGAARPRTLAPVVFLVVCAPVVVDLLFGATQLTTIAGLIPEITTYGFAALLIRGFARRLGAGWPAVLTSGIAFAVIAECLIVQTSLAPQAGPSAGWGRWAGVNWTYLIWALGYESGWAIALSIQLTDLLFTARRHQVWPRGRPLIALAAFSLLAAIPTWYNWTHIIAPRLLHQPVYQPPVFTLVAAAAVAIALIAVGWWLARQRPRPATPRPAVTRRRRSITLRGPPFCRPAVVPAIKAMVASAARRPVLRRGSA